MTRKGTFCITSLLVLSTSFLHAQGFTDVSVTAGTSFEHTGLPLSEDMQMGTGAAWFDYNQDGWLDIYITNRFAPNKLFRNNGDGTFTDVAGMLGVADHLGDGAGVVIGDINNDGYPDIFLANGNEDKLFRNNDGLSFADITNSAGLDVTGDSRGTSGSFGDYDKDGFIDLYVAHHAPVGGSSNATFSDFIFHNNGDETFTNVSSLVPAIHLEDAAFIAGWTDIDHDNDQDIIVITDCVFGSGPNLGTRVFRNDGGTDPVNDWTFTEIGSSIINDCSNGMGLGIGDYDRNGWMDIVYTDIGPAQLFNNRYGNFEDVSVVSNVGTQHPNHFSWGCSFLDYNNDGWQDILIAVGEFGLVPHQNDRPNNLFENNGDNTFTDVAVSMGVDEPSLTRTIVHGDYDNDGDLDLLMVNYDTIVTLYRNDVSNNNNFLRVSLTGTIGSRDALGSVVKITTPDNVVQYFEMKSGTNLGGGDEICAHFGIGTNNEVTEVEVTWLSGAVTTLNNIAANMHINIAEPLVLPVELSRFTGKVIDQLVRLQWTTDSEVNNAYFDVERSTDGVDFKKIGKVEGNGNSTEAHHYVFDDRKPANGNNYYRLKQVDLDGNHTYSQVIIKRIGTTQDAFTIFPNPVTGNILYTRLPATLSLPVTLALYDLAGREVAHKRIDEPYEGNQKLDIPADLVSNGIYIFKLIDPAGTRAKKILITR